MKTLNNYINEALIKKNTKIQQYKYYPKNFDELRSLLEKLLEERGKDANLNDIDVSQVTSFYSDMPRPSGLGLFEKLDPHNIDISDWDVSNVENMKRLFYECENFTGKGLENWDVSNVKDMEKTFKHCYEFTGTQVENWNVGKVKNMYCMFIGCHDFKGNLKKWNISNVENMSHMFAYCRYFSGNGLEKWNISNVKNMFSMFKCCERFTCDLSRWKPSSFTNTKEMFLKCFYLRNRPVWYKG